MIEIGFYKLMRRLTESLARRYPVRESIDIAIVLPRDGYDVQNIKLDWKPGAAVDLRLNVTFFTESGVHLMASSTPLPAEWLRQRMFDRSS